MEIVSFSTLSIATSFLAAALTMLRSSYFALSYAANDIVLIVLWVLASLEDPMYIPVVVNFVIFLINDLYGFVSWKHRENVLYESTDKYREKVKKISQRTRTSQSSITS